MKKEERLDIIRALLKTRKIGDQRQLLEILGDRGIQVTQATLSRDLHSLKVGRVPDPVAGTVYALPEDLQVGNNPLFSEEFPVDSVRSMDYSGHLAVMRCRPSFAPTIALIIDSLELPEVVGTIAGDDTILIVMNEMVSHEDFRTALIEAVPALKGHL